MAPPRNAAAPGGTPGRGRATYGPGHPQYITTAGLVDLEREIAGTPSGELLEQISLLIELPSTMQAIAWPRLRLSVWELQRRAEAGEMAGAA